MDIYCPQQSNSNEQRSGGCAQVSSSDAVLIREPRFDTWMLAPDAKRLKRSRDTDFINNTYLATTPPSVIEQCTQAFVEGTGNAALAKRTCGVCARRLPATDSAVYGLDDIPSPASLIPSHPHRAHSLFSGMLLHEAAVVERQTAVCNLCLRHLKKSQHPPLSLANNMWIGAVPNVLAVLTLPERVLIARHFPAAYIVKLYPKNASVRPDPRALTSGLRGNVTTYPLDVDKVAALLTTGTLPQHPRILAATIGISFVGVSNIPEKALRGLFRVSRDRVSSAIRWLVANNPIYGNVQINEAHLAELPEDDVPTQLLQTAKVHADSSALEEETAGYVPLDQCQETYNASGQPRSLLQLRISSLRRYTPCHNI